MSLVEGFMNIAARFGGSFDFVMRTPHRLGTPRPSAAPESAATPARARAHPGHAAPVLLIPGFPSIPHYLKVMQRSLMADGFRAYIMAAPNNGLGDAREAARQVAAAVAMIQRREHASHVNLVGHSRGGILARDAAEHFIPRGVVGTVVSIGSPHHGVRLARWVERLHHSFVANWVLPPSRAQMIHDSDYVKYVGLRHDARQGVRLVNIFYQEGDGVVAPDSAFLPGAENHPIPRFGWFPHLQIVTHDGAVYEEARRALEAPARPRRRRPRPHREAR